MQMLLLEQSEMKFYIMAVESMTALSDVAAETTAFRSCECAYLTVSSYFVLLMVLETKF